MRKLTSFEVDHINGAKTKQEECMEAKEAAGPVGIVAVTLGTVLGGIWGVALNSKIGYSAFIGMVVAGATVAAVNAINGVTCANLE